MTFGTPYFRSLGTVQFGTDDMTILNGSTFDILLPYRSLDFACRIATFREMF